MSIFEENHDLIFDNIKKLLNNGAKNRNHAFHTPVFSNINKDNLANSRIVVLRNFDDSTLKLNFHTDFRSPKIKDLKINNNSYFVFYDSKIKIQLRIKTISIINHKNNITKNAWEITRLLSRKCYLTESAPSSFSDLPTDGIPNHLKGIDPQQDESEKGYENFIVVQNEIQNIDWLYLDYSGHRRLNIDFKGSKILFNWMIP